MGATGLQGGHRRTATLCVALGSGYGGLDGVERLLPVATNRLRIYLRNGRLCSSIICRYAGRGGVRGPPPGPWAALKSIEAPTKAAW